MDIDHEPGGSTMLHAMRTPEPPPGQLTNVPFRGSQAVAEGLITRSQLQSSQWVRIFRDVYRWVGLEDCAAIRAEAATLLLPPGAVVSGRAAAYLLGIDVRWTTDGLEVTVPRGSNRFERRELVVLSALLPADDIVEVGGVPVTSPLRTAFDLARRPNLREGVVAVDAFAHAELLDLADLLSYGGEHRGWRGVRQVRRVIELADPKAESPGETRLRLVVVIDGRFPRPECQIEVWTESGIFVARIDLGYRWKKLGIEYDGADHRKQWECDLDRQNLLKTAGWEPPLRYRNYHVMRARQSIVRQVGKALYG